MSARTDTLESFETTERLNRPLAWSVSCHIVLFGAAALWSAYHVPISLGDPSGHLGGAVAVNIVQGIPLPRSNARVESPVANPVKHDVPAAQEAPKIVPKAAEEDAAAVPIPAETKKAAGKSQPKPKVQKSAPKTSQNQVTSSTGGAVSSPIYSGQQQTSGVGGVGFGSGSPFGARFGWYAEAIQRRLAEEWRRTLGQVDANALNPVVVSFRISRNGALDSIQIVQSSGNRSLDYSAQRAVTNANPMQPLPPGLGRSSIYVEMWFRLQ